jgi:hypothetical protein
VPPSSSVLLKVLFSDASRTFNFQNVWPPANPGNDSMVDAFHELLRDKKELRSLSPGIATQVSQTSGCMLVTFSTMANSGGFRRAKLPDEIELVLSAENRRSCLLTLRRRKKIRQLGLESFCSLVNGMVLERCCRLPLPVLMSNVVT